jgi:hypothetical protein
MQIHIDTKFVVIEEISFIYTIKHGENMLFCGRKLNEWELGKISYMQKVRTRHNG